MQELENVKRELEVMKNNLKTKDEKLKEKSKKSMMVSTMYELEKQKVIKMQKEIDDIKQSQGIDVQELNKEADQLKEVKI